MSVNLTIEDMGERTPAYRALWRRLLSPLLEEGAEETETEEDTHERVESD